jgi:hypothetical protein
VFFRIPDDGQCPKLSNPDCDTVSSEPFRIKMFGVKREEVNVEKTV